MDFGKALTALKEGKKVSRSGWNGKAMFLVLFIPEHHNVEAPLIHGAGKFPMKPFILMKTADNHFVPWLASQTDVLAEDWTEDGNTSAKMPEATTAPNVEPEKPAATDTQKDIAKAKTPDAEVQQKDIAPLFKVVGPFHGMNTNFMVGSGS